MKRAREEKPEPIALLAGPTGRLVYWPHVMRDVSVQPLLMTLPWAQEVIVMRGLTTRAPRETVALGDPGLVYRYAGQMKTTLPWSQCPLVLELKARVEAITGARVNFALCNLYRTGTDYIGYHADDTRDLVPGSRILSLSLGVERDFYLKPVSAAALAHDKGLVKLALAHGTLLAMDLPLQQHYKHSVPVRRRVTLPRVNITFRLVKQ